MFLKSLVFRLFLFFFPHFSNVFLVQHIIFHIFPSALLYQKKGHCNKKKANGSEANEFVGQLKFFLLDGKPIKD